MGRSALGRSALGSTLTALATTFDAAFSTPLATFTASLALARGPLSFSFCRGIAGSKFGAWGLGAGLDIGIYRRRRIVFLSDKPAGEKPSGEREMGET